MKFLQTLSDWSEVWALLIPLIVIIVSRPKEKQIRVLVWYVIIGFILNFATTFMIEFRNLVPSWLYIDNMINNNIVYNIHSMFRVLLFSWYIINIRQYQFTFFLKILLAAYLVFIFINFTILATVPTFSISGIPGSSTLLSFCATTPINLSAL